MREFWHDFIGLLTFIVGVALLTVLLRNNGGATFVKAAGNAFSNALGVAEGGTPQAGG